jgi:hypothetical protein
MNASNASEHKFEPSNSISHERPPSTERLHTSPIARTTLVGEPHPPSPLGIDVLPAQLKQQQATNNQLTTKELWRRPTTRESRPPTSLPHRTRNTKGVPPILKLKNPPNASRTPATPPQLTPPRPTCHNLPAYALTHVRASAQDPHQSAPPSNRQTILSAPAPRPRQMRHPLPYLPPPYPRHQTVR